MVPLHRRLHTGVSVALALLLAACGGGQSDDDARAPSGPPGLSERPENQTCLATRFTQDSTVALKPLVPEGTFTAPVGAVSHPSLEQVLYVLEQRGTIWRLDLSEANPTPALFVDLRDYTDVQFEPTHCFECGLFSMAFHPDFEQNGFVHVSLTEGGEAFEVAPESYVARFRSDDEGMSLVQSGPGELERTDIYHVQQTTEIHNNGRLAFGPDNYLYVSFGDGGPGGDPNRNAQDPTNPFGTLLRLTDEGAPAPGNQVEGGLPEVFAYGLRNPWQWSFDRETGELWAGDVGQGRTEEINRIVNGANYGWPCLEGADVMQSCSDTSGFEAPVFSYQRGDGRSVTGGYVYRGEQLDNLYGVYLFSDFASGLLWGLFTTPEGDLERRQLLDTGGSVVSFGEELDGELLLVDYEGGQVSRLVAEAQDSRQEPIPEWLSETGCMNPDNPAEPGDGLIPYDVREPFWSDGADKARYLALPDDATIDVDETGDFDLPVGSVLVKQFYRHDELIETRLMLNQPATGWVGHSYRWNSTGTDARRVTEPEDVEVQGQLWHYPSSAECSQCHTSAAGDSLGLEVRQLNTDFDYAGTTANQLDTLAAIGVLTEPLTRQQRANPLVDSRDESHPLDLRVRAYLHSNCANCHRPGGTSQASMDLRFDTLPEAMNLCNVGPMQSDLGIEDACLLAPGEPERSLLWQRLTANDGNRMPPLGSHVLDDHGIGLIEDWIAQMDECTGFFAPVGEALILRNVGIDQPLGEDGTQDPLAASWQLEPEGPSYYRIRLAGTDQYLHAEQVQPMVGTIEPGWLSAQWFPEREGDSVRWRNRWHENQYLSVDAASGELQLRDAANLDDNTLWQVRQHP